LCSHPWQQYYARAVAAEVTSTRLKAAYNAAAAALPDTSNGTAGEETHSAKAFANVSLNTENKDYFARNLNAYKTVAGRGTTQGWHWTFPVEASKVKVTATEKE